MAAHGKVHVSVFYFGLGELQGQVVALFHYGVDVALLLGECAAYRCGARVVGAIVVVGFRACVDEQQSSGFQLARAGVAVEYFAVHGYDTRERYHTPV